MPTVESSTSTIITTTTHLDREAVVLTDEDDALIAEWNDLKAQRKALDERIDEIVKGRFAPLFADGAEVALYNGKVRLVASRRERKSIDSDLLGKMFPEAKEATERTTPYTVYTSK